MSRLDDYIRTRDRLLITDTVHLGDHATWRPELWTLDVFLAQSYLRAMHDRRPFEEIDRMIKRAVSLAATYFLPSPLAYEYRRAIKAAERLGELKLMEFLLGKLKGLGVPLEAYER